MNHLTPALMKVGAVVALAVGSYALTPVAFAAPPADTVAATAPDLQAKADYYAKRAADYRTRAKTDSKRAIIWFTMANYCDQQAERYRKAAGAEPPIGTDRIGAIGAQIVAWSGSGRQICRPIIEARSCLIEARGVPEG